MPLSSAEEYHYRATVIRERAEKLPAGSEQAGLLKLASVWDRLGEHKKELELGPD
jgi:hypothetical protein